MYLHKKIEINSLVLFELCNLNFPQEFVITVTLDNSKLYAGEYQPQQCQTQWYFRIDQLPQQFKYYSMGSFT